MKGLIGVLGGMGPAATVDLFNKFVTFTAAQRDQEHIPLIISSIPDIPDRTDALMHNGLSPLPLCVTICINWKMQEQNVLLFPVIPHTIGLKN